MPYEVVRVDPWVVGALLFAIAGTAWLALTRPGGGSDTTKAATAETNLAESSPVVRVSPIVVFLMVAILLAVTNPSHSDFENYIHRQLSSSSRPTSDPLAQAFSRLITSGIAASAERSDYAFFSLYRLRLDHRSEQWWVGILKQFVAWPTFTAPW